MASSGAVPERPDRRAVRLRRLGLLVALLLAALAALWGTTARVDERFRLTRDTMRSGAASGQIVIVEIDARSLNAISDWPWPRRVHAALVDMLHASGAATIAFDVDFSSTSNPLDDGALASSLARADGKVVLPTFRQPVSQGSDRFSENLPIAAFRPHVFLGSVNVQPDADGQLRRYSYGTVTGGVPRPSLAALLAGTPGTIADSFRVDTAIDPATVPRISAIDVLNGKAPPLKGRSVLVGATAIEMGDRYVVPGHGVLPGVVVQALAGETLLRGSVNPDWGPWPALLYAALLLALTAGKRFYWPAVMAATMLLTLVPLVFEMAHMASFQIAPALLLIGLDVALVVALMLRRWIDEGRSIDADTGLPNARALARACRGSGTIGITVVRLQQYEEIAAVLSEGDRATLMTQVIARLAVAFPQATLHAVESGILAWPSPEPTEADHADAAAALFRAPVSLASRPILITPAFGVSQGDGIDAAHLLSRAGIAARQAQAAGRRWLFESCTLSSDTDRSLALIADIEAAIAAHDIYLVYQAKWDVARERIAGAEALVRWHHPVFGPLSPDEFIPILETNGQMRALTLAVVDRCTEQLHSWQARDLGIAINISAPLLDDPEFTNDLEARLAALGDLATRVTLEITESATLAGTGAAVAALTRFRTLGSRVSIDDYGTGQATLAYLKTFPADEIKIDKSFVTHMLANGSDQIVVRSTIELAHQLGFKVVAEGVEDAECLARLRDYGCDTIQGWVIGKPVRADAFIEAIAHDPLALAA